MGQTSGLPLEFGHTLNEIPTGFRLKAQGCEARATLGNTGEKGLNSNGIAAVENRSDATPLGLDQGLVEHAVAAAREGARSDPGAVQDLPGVAQTSESAVSQVSKPAGARRGQGIRKFEPRTEVARAADLEVGDTADLEVCATGRASASDALTRRVFEHLSVNPKRRAVTGPICCGFAALRSCQEVCSARCTSGLPLDCGLMNLPMPLWLGLRRARSCVSLSVMVLSSADEPLGHRGFSGSPQRAAALHATDAR